MSEDGGWGARTLAARLKVLHGARGLLAWRVAELVAAMPLALRRSEADTLVAEVLPLLDACKFLEREAAGILRSRKLGRHGRPAWLSGVTGEVRREPWGRVLVIGPANFPLFLPGVQTVQALAAGNRVTWKPGRGAAAVAVVVAEALWEAGVPREALRVTDDSVGAAQAAMGDADFVVFTGSRGNGRAVLRQLAETATPSLMELSGCDAVVVLAGADIAEVRRALRFATELNGGEVCMRPRRLVGAAALLDRLHDAAAAQGLDVIVAETETAAIDAVNASEFGLTVAVFCGAQEVDAAERLAAAVTAGVVLVNDVIAPTADPRAPFGGRGASGFGVTRGAEGLLAMTTPKVVMRRAAGSKARHFALTTPAHATFFAAWIRARHGATLGIRLKAMRAWVDAARGVQAAEKRISKEAETKR